jgi:predicted membrane protein
MNGLYRFILLIFLVILIYVLYVFQDYAYTKTPIRKKIIKEKEPKKVRFEDDELDGIDDFSFNSGGLSQASKTFDSNYSNNSF